jgi:hypothetical protein
MDGNAHEELSAGNGNIDAPWTWNEASPTSRGTLRGVLGKKK